MQSDRMHSEASAIEVDLPGLTVALLPRASYCARFKTDALRIGFAFDVQHGFHAFASDRVVPFITRPSTVAVTQAGCDIYSSSDLGGEYLTLQLSAPQSSEFETTDNRPALTNLPVQRAVNPARHLRKLLLQAEADPCLLEQTGLGFADAVFDGLDLPSSGAKRGAPSLSNRRLRDLNDYLEAHLGERISVSTMACIVGLRPRFFLRAFRAATGTTPHAYLIERRMEVARRKLRETRETVTSIAYATGFASASHFATQFKRTFGMTPIDYR